MPDLPVSLLLLAGFSLATVACYRLLFHPLSHVPGPFFAAISSLFHWTISVMGIECEVLAYYHRRYKTKVLRVGPNFVSVADVNALRPIYATNGGFVKDSHYCNFDREGEATIFSSLDRGYRDVRAKASLPLFAPARIRSAGGNQDLGCYVVKFVARAERAKEVARQGNNPVDLLDLCHCLSVDVMTGYMFDRPYGALEEIAKVGEGTQLSSAENDQMCAAGRWVQAIGAVGRYAQLPSWMFSIVIAIYASFWDAKRVESMQQVEQFLNSLLPSTSPATSAPPSEHDLNTYHGRLLNAGATPKQVMGICEGTLFAATGSTGMVLAVILFHLVQQPCIRENLQREMQNDTASDPFNRPYLRAVVREGLRLSKSNPAPLTRSVPAGGCVVDGIVLPPGISVGAANYVFHHDPEAFPDPHRFYPERWLENNESGTGRGKQQRSEKDFFPFGIGSRACIGQNLAMHQLLLGVSATVQSGVLDGAVTCQERLRVYTYFNGEVEGNRIDVRWT